MMECPFCKSGNTLRRGLRQRDWYLALCAACGSPVTVPRHEYFQLYNLSAASIELTGQRKQRHEVSA